MKLQAARQTSGPGLPGVRNENATELVQHAKANDQHTSIQEITEICYLSCGTIYRIMDQEPCQKGVRKVDPPLPYRDTKK